MKLKLNSGFTLVELFISLAIIAVLSIVVSTMFIDFRKNQALDKDTDTIVETLRQARNQTLSSKNASAYGVHITSTKVILFTGTSYVFGAATNSEFNLNSTDSILTISLNGGGSDVIFNRLTGETSQNGTIVVNSVGLSRSKTVTIYKTGLVEFQ